MERQMTKTGEIVEAYTIQEASNLTMLPVEVIEYMEQEGFLPPTIFKSGHFFTSYQVRLLREIAARSITAIIDKTDLRKVLKAIKGEIALSWSDLQGTPFYKLSLEPVEKEDSE